jgi:hypothetical protein
MAGFCTIELALPARNPSMSIIDVVVIGMIQYGIDE